MKAMTVSLIPDPSPAAGRREFCEAHARLSRSGERFLKMLHRFCLRAKILWRGLLLAAAPALVLADSTASSTFTTAGREPLAIHAYFMAMITVLFVVVFVITIYTMAKHRKICGDQASKFSGPTGTVQWLWAMVPFAILLFVDYLLISLHFAG